MRWPWKRKQKIKMSYQIYCRNCDIFYYKTKDNDRKCPSCGRDGFIWATQIKPKD